MLDFKKSGKPRIQMFLNANGYYVVRKCVKRKWEISYTTADLKEAENWFYWLILLYNRQLKYISEYPA